MPESMTILISDRPDGIKANTSLDGEVLIGLGVIVAIEDGVIDEISVLDALVHSAALFDALFNLGGAVQGIA
jgi:hypothetical protein